MILIKERVTGRTLYHSSEGWLAGADLSCLSLPRASLAYANLENADLSKTCLCESILCHAILRETNLTGADLTTTDLHAAYLANAIMHRADLTDALLEGAVMCQSDLSQASLRGANLRLVNLSGADLTAADLTGANLEGALLQSARFDRATKWPCGFNPERGIPSRTSSMGADRTSAMTYQVNSPKPNTVQLWTVQELAVWDRLQRSKALHTNPDYINPVFMQAYEWMCRQMNRRLSGYGNHFPWWAWLRPKPDLRRYGRSKYPGDRQVRLQLAVPQDKVLLSDYMSWHAVLNGRYLALCEEEESVWYACLAKRGIDRFVWPLPEPWFSKMVTSWERMFDLRDLVSKGYWSTGCVQATFECLELESVVEVTEFMTRKK
jgi:hypothetical protein